MENNRTAVQAQMLILGTALLLLGVQIVPIACPSQQALAQTVRETQKAEAGKLYQQATQQLNQGQSREALTTLQQVLVLVRQINERLGEGATLNQIALAYYNMGQYPQAMDAYQKALTIFRELSDRAGEGVTLNNIAVVYRNLGQYQKALSSYQQTLVIRRQVGDRQGEATTLNNLAAVYDNLGQYQKALTFYQQALVIFQEVKDRRGEGTTLNNIGFAYQNQGQAQEALTSYQQALTILQETGDRIGIGRTLSYIGLAYSHLGLVQKAQESLEQALLIRREIGDKPGEGVTLDSLGTLYREQGEYQKALNSYQQALKITREVGDRPGEGQTLSNIGSTFLKKGVFTAAIEKLQAAIEVWESLRPGLTDENKVSLFDRQADTYGLLQEALIAQHQIQAALEISERGRARAFAELLSSQLGAVPSETIQSVKPPTFAQIQQVAADYKATLVEYSIVRNKLYIWVISPQKTLNFRQVDIRNLESSLTEVVLRTLAAAATDRNRGNQPQENLNLNPLLKPAGIPQKEQKEPIVSVANLPRFKNNRLYQSYQILIEPIAELLPKNPNDRVIFIPHRSLFLVPFVALQDRAGNYLIEKHTILIAPSVQVLDLTHQRRQHRQQHPASEVLVVGNPTMPSIPVQLGEQPMPLSPLLGAEGEALAIARILGTQAITGRQATETAVVKRMPKAKIIHLATHGLFNELKHLGLRVPGAIALTPSDRDDGLLTSEEILHLKLNADLVVLSACNTGRGNITSDGVIGLSRSLMSAGASSVVVSLWAVPDVPTELLMTQFYRWMQQTPDKAQALRQAMLTTMKQHPNPSSWAAFTLIGEAE